MHNSSLEVVRLTMHACMDLAWKYLHANSITTQVAWAKLLPFEKGKALTCGRRRLF